MISISVNAAAHDERRTANGLEKFPTATESVAQAASLPFRRLPVGSASLLFWLEILIIVQTPLRY
jgi:hypothetical protein